jgi:8-oxo-dGTP pyrophosphatase MutT (NUDIX family)
MQSYVLGYLFSLDKKQVVLIQKNRPDFLKDKWNAVGGHIEENELPHAAMVREFEEETGLLISDWGNAFCIVRAKDYQLHVFKAFSDKIDKVKSVTEEEVAVFDLRELKYITCGPKVEMLMYLALETDLEIPVMLFSKG